MPLILSVRGYHPVIASDCFIAENATIVGDVVIGSKCSIWFNSVIRGDVNAIRIGAETNIQDGVIIHCTFQKSETHIGERVSIGHGAIIHGCKIESEVLIGMGAIVMDNAIVQSRVIVAAGAVVPEGMVLESGYIYAGIPARKLKPLDQENFKFFIDRTSKNYQMYADWFK
ncbi:MAG: gamma carbonic anhydrase family protein [Saprospiraceae bacterium]|nr:gamma carbonic anhydrase family protein [Saprospiraceae bacterium]HMW38708.1 gamma carbonic anhydrase family protein [Saprospiraceae bacterium]HMX87925.1 gamma carbonic anhydrase family protein [Saprospiraceae bacterium]HMZ40024.1 gamma carbonic anhydrase family protein [Saprospiraceae bacterium]HNA64414.1 gamma carbonic anhydrase family protein [Saprospiraceae bacterium]